ncbi:MAG: hypothetical protein Q7J68_01275 [Thermoplasmata archaeon]|nr:hypothetical protein [Thermoplasmata archaeon]
MEYDTTEKVRKKFAARHWKAIAMIVVGIALAVIAMLAVFVWFVGDAQDTGLVPSRLGGWSVGSCVTFFLHLLFWEIVLVVIPLIVAAILIYYLWWKRLPAEERAEYRRMKIFGRSKSTKGGSGISFVVNLLVLLKVYLDHNWNTPFSSWSVDYVVSSYLWALMWILIIVGVPVLIGAVWWLKRQASRSG